MALNNYVTSISFVLSTNSMLSSIFSSPVGPSGMSIFTTTYIGKDIVGQLACLAYSWKSGKKSEPLRNIQKGVALQQVGVYLENSSILISENMVLPFLGMTSTMKNISFIKIGAVNATCLQKLAESGENGGDIGDIYSKVASINTLTSTMGMLTGIGLIHILPSYTLRTCICLPLLTMISLYSVKQAVNSCYPEKGK